MQAKIYQNGVVTMLAGDAASARNGFLYRRKSKALRFEISVRLRGDDVEKVSILLTPPVYQPQIDPMSTRAWIFQESKSELPKGRPEPSLIAARYTFAYFTIFQSFSNDTL